jgi:hypothetical protein
VQVLLLPGDANPTLNILSITPNSDGSMRLRFIGIPRLVYEVQARESLDPLAPWLALGTVTAGVNGVFEFTDHDAAGHSMRYYRTVGP